MNKFNPIVSIIVPVYIVENYLEKCVNSIISQTLNNIQIVLVDDGSTDNSSKICDDFARKYSNIEVIHKNNEGLGFARNSGLEIAKGDYIGFIDSDDYIADSMYMTLYNLAIRYNSDCVFCLYQKFRDEDAGTVAQQKKTEKVYAGDTILDSYLLDRIGLNPKEKEDCSYGASVTVGLFKRSIINNNHIRFVSERDFISEDMIFDIELIPYCKAIVHIDSCLYYYRFNPDSLTKSYVGNRFERNVVLWKEMVSRLKVLYPFEKCKNSIYRYFLTFTRIALIEEVIHMKENGRKNAQKNIYRMASNENLNMILHTYPIAQMSIFQRIFFLALKNKWYHIVVSLIRINLLIRKCKPESRHVLYKN